MFGRKQKEVKRWKVKVTSLSDAVPFDLQNSEFELDLTRNADINIHADVINCDNGGGCDTKTRGGFRIEVTPIR